MTIVVVERFNLGDQAPEFNYYRISKATYAKAEAFIQQKMNEYLNRGWFADWEEIEDLGHWCIASKDGLEYIEYDYVVVDTCMEVEI